MLSSVFAKNESAIMMERTLARVRNFMGRGRLGSRLTELTRKSKYLASLTATTKT